MSRINEFMKDDDIYLSAIQNRTLITIIIFLTLLFIDHLILNCCLLLLLVPRFKLKLSNDQAKTYGWSFRTKKKIGWGLDFVILLLG